MMKRVLLTALFGGVVLVVGGASGLAFVWLAGGAALAGGFGWMMGGLPGGASGAEGGGGHDGSGSHDSGGDSGGGGGE
jgi:hypothetical protein